MALFGKTKEAGTTAKKFGTKMLKKIAASAKKVGSRDIFGKAKKALAEKQKKKHRPLLKQRL